MGELSGQGSRLWRAGVALDDSGAFSGTQRPMEALRPLGVDVTEFTLILSRTYQGALTQRRQTAPAGADPVTLAGADLFLAGFLLGVHFERADDDG